jgi:hypothetical protein
LKDGERSPKFPLWEKYLGRLVRALYEDQLLNAAATAARVKHLQQSASGTNRLSETGCSI